MDIFLILLSAILNGLSRLPFHCGWMGFISVIPLLCYFERGKKKGKILLRDAFIYNAAGLTIWLHWIWGVTAWGFIGIIVFYTIYYYLAFLAVQLIWQKLPRFKYIGFIVIMLSVQYLQNFTEFRFPWLDLGYSLTDYTVLLQAADIGGIAFLSLLLLVCNVLLYNILRGKYKNLIPLGLILILWVGYGLWCFKSVKLTKTDEHITIMQPSIPQNEKWETEHFDELFKRYNELTAQAAQDSTKLLIWPEAAMPTYLLRDHTRREMVQELCNIYHLDIFTGFPDVLPAPENYPGEAYYYNAATLFKPFQKYDEPYYKIILVPVGERIPYLNYFPFLWKLQFGQANWEYGPACRYFNSGNLTFSSLICFEIAFPELIHKMAFRNEGENKGGPPDKIDFLVNITNDAWFGRSVGPWMHGMMTKFRAVENRIQIYRCANTGISMAVDPMGRVLTQTKLFEIKNIKAPLYRADKVPLYYYLYRWPRLIILLALVLIVCALLNDKILFPSGKRLK
ncbi:MAG TPA: apolipoprotein N-acyltransferase [Candidatus Cloacimonadota bacterium]|nr:apolipoprotein N-acyltransferase [Candidatus Cloacimonadota bacterium]HQL14707.1 apolipoprotein N-acyltransferase [Candidatus Cloacimonadota bacterium]